jgi:hypothetical protein
MIVIKYKTDIDSETQENTIHDVLMIYKSG